MLSWSWYKIEGKTKLLDISKMESKNANSNGENVKKES